MNELRILQVLDVAVRSRTIRPKIDAAVARVEGKLQQAPGDVLAWEPVPLDLFTAPIPETIRSSWVFVLRRGTTTGAERHPNSHQRMMSWRGSGDFQTRPNGGWTSHLLSSEPALPMADRWISIPAGVWHQGVVGDDDWAVVSFHTVPEHELIEERLSDGGGTVRRRRYVDHGRSS